MECLIILNVCKEGGDGAGGHLAPGGKDVSFPSTVPAFARTSLFSYLLRQI